MFADLAARRKDLEDRRGTIANRLDAAGRTQKMAGPTPAQPSTHELSKQARSDMARVLSSDTLPGREKRDLIGSVLSHVVCQPEGADVYYLPGVFPAASPFDNSMLTDHSIEPVTMVCCDRPADHGNGPGDCTWHVVAPVF